MKRNVLFCSGLFACLILAGCKDNPPAPVPKAPAAPAPQAPAAPQEQLKVETAAPAAEKVTLPQLLKRAEKLCQALADNDLSFDQQQAVETLTLLKAEKSNREARNAVAELSAALRACFQKYREPSSSMLPDIQLQAIAQLLPLLEQLSDAEYKDARYRMKATTMMLVHRLDQAYGAAQNDDAGHERPKQMLLTALAVYDADLQALAADFWDAEKAQEFSKCFVALEQIAKRESEQHDELTEQLRNIFSSRINHWREKYAQKFSATSDEAVQKALLKEMAPLFEEKDMPMIWANKDWLRRFEQMNEEYRRRVEEESRQRPQYRPQRPQHSRPRSRAEFEQMRQNNSVIRAIATGQPALLDQLLAQGASLEKVRINGKTPYSFLLENIERGRRVGQNKAVLSVLMRHGVKPTDAEAAKLKEIMPTQPGAAK